MVTAKVDNKTLLVFPPGWEPVMPIGLAYLKSFLEENDFESRIFDLNILYAEDLFEAIGDHNKKKRILESAYKALKEEVISYNPKVIAFTMLEPTFMSAVFLIKKLKSDFNDDIITVAGGPHVSYLKKKILDFKVIDVAIPGEGELPLLDLVERITSGKKLHSSLYYTRKDKKVVGGTDLKFIKDLDTIPFPDYSDLKFDSYPFPFIISIFGRGCINGCIFCGVPYIYNNYRERSPDNIYSEIKRNVEEYGFNVLAFTDSLLNANPVLTKKICKKIIDDKRDINWMAEVHPSISKDLGKVWYQAGCRFLYISPETGSQKTADRMNKGVNIKEAEKSIKNAHDNGIYKSVWFIVGFPFEKPSELDETFRFMNKIWDYSEEILISPFGLSINTPIYYDFDKFGITNVKERGYDLYCTYDTTDPDLGFENQMKRTLELYKKYNPAAYNSKMMRLVAEIMNDKNSSREDKFLLSESFQFPYKLYGVEYDEDYSYIYLFQGCFKEVLK